MNLLRGKKVFELSVVETDKGTAFAELVDEIGATATVFIGDDVTDEHAFEALGPRDLTVKVGGRPDHRRDPDRRAVPGRRPADHPGLGPAPGAGAPLALALMRSPAAPRTASS